MSKIAEMVSAKLALLTDSYNAAAKTLITPVYNVVGYGAKGDGVTDDATAIQAAFTAVPAAGGTVVFPPGTYPVSAPINIPSNCMVLGFGPGFSIVKLTTAGTSVFTNSDHSGGNTNIVIDGLKIDGNSLSSSGAVYFVKASYSTVKNCEVLNSAWNGIHFEGTASRNTAANNVIHDSARHGIQIYNQMDECLISGNVIYGCHKDGIQVYTTCLRSRIVNNEISAVATDDAGAGTWAGINLYDASGYTIIEGNQVHDIPDNLGIRAKNSSHAIIRGNSVYNTLAGITLFMTSSNAERCTQTIIEGNNIELTKSHAIYTTSTCADGTASIKGSIIRGNIVHNVGDVTNNQSVGIRLLYAQSCIVEGNVVSEVAYQGISLSNDTTNGIATQNCVISGNVTRNAGKYYSSGTPCGIYAGGGGLHTIAGNQVYDDQVTKTQVSGIYVKGDKNVVDSNQTVANKTTNLNDTGTNTVLGDNGTV